MKQIKFLGASGTVTGSSYILTGSKGTNVMVDLGMFQGTEEIEKLNFAKVDFDLSKVDIALLTHAHLDHCGRLPLLVKNGFSGNIYMNQPTQLLAEVVMYDSAKISSIEHPDNPLYENEDVALTIDKIRLIDYRKKLNFHEFDIIFRNAGHILGSASIEV
ncbi:MBL fold metallo-hydrolase, partial [Patescibacteria group bacterium]